MELGVTVCDIEIQVLFWFIIFISLFLEAASQIILEVGHDNAIVIQVSLVSYVPG
jgi:CTP synthase (UTP-ammonia lyase)